MVKADATDSMHAVSGSRTSRRALIRNDGTPLPASFHIAATQSISMSNGPGQEWMNMKMRDGASVGK